MLFLIITAVVIMAIMLGQMGRMDMSIFMILMLVANYHESIYKYIKEFLKDIWPFLLGVTIFVSLLALVVYTVYSISKAHAYMGT